MEPRILFAVVTCHRRTYAPEAQHHIHKNQENTHVEWVRKTWLANAAGKVDVRFFYGNAGVSEQPASDEIFLDVGDDYYSLVPKTRAVFQWALDHGYTHILKLDDDVFVDVDKTLTGFQDADYRGTLREGQVNVYGTSELTCKYACGPAYWLSRRAMQTIVDSPLPATPYEDRATGYALIQSGIPLTESNDLCTCLCKDCLTNPRKYIQFHVEEPAWRERFLQKHGIRQLQLP
jgi:galactosyltransferase